MLSNLKHILSSHLLNIPGWRTKRKIVIIESDDWGSIRMPSKEVYNNFIKAGIPLNNCPYNRYDSLASENDLQDLFNILITFKDLKGNHPIITANTVVANPDFEKILNSDFQEYYYEPFTRTLEKYPAHANAFEFWKGGIGAKLFYPQFHSREHVSINLWLKLLQNNHPIYLKAFENTFWGIGPSIIKHNSRINIQATFDANNSSEIDQHKNQLVEGLKLFEKIFGYRSRSFIANNFIWDSFLNRTLKENGVDVLQGMKYQLLPLLNQTKRKKIRHYTGKINAENQVHLIRNCSFEPSENPGIDNVGKCLCQISNAFFFKKPAIISTHRLNYIGFIDEQNKVDNLKTFRILISSILKRWPEVEFITSDKLGDLIIKDQQNQPLLSV
ncbi:MAG: hypothetical protein ISR56_10925 [Bacteroidales bacterium]|nr:hypothetical protein [Bacteroidales bacterium]